MLITGGGLSGSLNNPVKDDIKHVAPASASEFNRVISHLIPLACWRLEDVRFEFDSSFISPIAAEELKALATLMAAHPGSPASIFGHADPVGNEEYNKALSGRRAAAVYGMLRRRVDIWMDLFDHPFGGDEWGEKVISTIQSDLGVPVTGKANSGARSDLFLSYMNKHCRKEDGSEFKLEKTDFLGNGDDPTGRGDFQGCSEFNPILIFSEAEQKELSKQETLEKRNLENAPNRRVVVYLFRAGSRVLPAKWPCPSAKDSTAGCRKRFHTDGQIRLKPQVVRREHENTHDTFACRFYERLVTTSPCETIVRRLRFRYGFEVGPHLPWTDGALLRIVSEDGKSDSRFPAQRGSASGTHRFHVFMDVRPGLRYRGELLNFDGKFRLPLFDFVDLGKVVDSVDPLNILPIVEPPPQKDAGPLPPVDPVPVQTTPEEMDPIAVAQAAGDPPILPKSGAS